ncbi:MAG: hypothetical protein ACE366_18845 [Bradymonadia bacterium]
MILGVNQDVRYKGKTYHIQTEDSGPEPPVIHTHIFVGGSIVTSRRMEYGEVVGHPDMDEQVRSMMRAQHREVHDALIAGELDDVLRSKGPKIRADIPLARNRGGSTPAPKTPAPQKSPVATPAPATPEPSTAEPSTAGASTPEPSSSGPKQSPAPQADKTVINVPIPEEAARTTLMPALNLDDIAAKARAGLHQRFEEVLSSVLVDAPPVTPSGPARAMNQGPLPKALDAASEHQSPPEFIIPMQIGEPIAPMILVYLAEDLEDL